MTSPGSRVSATVTATIVAVPVGSIISYIFDPSNAPSDWLWCNGAPFDQTLYPDLYRLMGNKNTLPDFRGYFLRGLDATGKVDPDGPTRILQSVQADMFASHEHTWRRTAWFNNEPIGGDWRYTEMKSADAFQHWEPTSAAGGPETRPKNVAVHYLIYAGLQTAPSK